MKSGLFITFEGSEGCGKSTQIGLLEERLKEEGREVLRLREPGGTELGEKIRNLFQHDEAGEGMSPETELLLVNASRAQLVREKIRPALERGAIVLCDRFYDSTVAYQGYGRGLDLALVRRVIDVAVGDTRPDCTFLISLPRQLAEHRLKIRSALDEWSDDRMEKSERDFFERVEEGFFDLNASEGGRIHLIEGSRAIEVVQAEIWEEVETLLGTHGVA
jgi:dTMP kinase